MSQNDFTCSLKACEMCKCIVVSGRSIDVRVAAEFETTDAGRRAAPSDRTKADHEYCELI